MLDEICRNCDFRDICTDIPERCGVSHQYGQKINMTPFVNARYAVLPQRENVLERVAQDVQKK